MQPITYETHLEQDARDRWPEVAPLAHAVLGPGRYEERVAFHRGWHLGLARAEGRVVGFKIGLKPNGLTTTVVELVEGGEFHLEK